MRLLLSTIVLTPLLFGQAAPRPATFATPAPARDVTITAIPGVIDAAAKWTLVWQGMENADGIVASPDGGLLFAQEQTNKILKLDRNDKLSVFLSNGHGNGAIAIGPKGRIVVVERTCTDPGAHPDTCAEPTGIAALTPSRKVLASSIGGKPLGRVNDVVVARDGNIYFTSGGAFRISPQGEVTTFGENLRTNGIMLSPDEKTLYITNGPVVAAFDRNPDGSVKNQREFGKLEGGGNGDGMVIDSTGRLFVTTNPGVQVLGPDGKYLGIIATPRNAISVSFTGPDHKTMYVAAVGALDPDGKEHTTPAGVRNTAMTIYKISVLTQGFKGRPK
jgi:gluconolactonase